jgi:DNA-binding protein HU-beta
MTPVFQIAEEKIKSLKKAKGEDAMTKGDLVSAVAKAAGLNKSAAGDAVDAIFDSLARAIRKDKRFQVPGFGTFTVRSRKARKGRNPQTGDEIAIRASRTVGFKPAPDLKRGL